MTRLDIPMGLGLVVCDQIIEDKQTGKKTLVGLFDRVQATRLPCVHPSMAVLVSLTGARGEFPCEVICKHTGSSAIAFSAKGKVKLKDPRQVVDLVFRLNSVRFPEAEMYWLSFVVDDVPIMMRPLFVSLRKEGKEKPDDNDGKMD